MTEHPPDGSSDRPVETFQNAFPAASCAGCGRVFTPGRKDQRHCRPSCRVLALQRRRDEAQTRERGSDGDRLAGLFE